jgi:hypothetical protein
MAEPIHSYATSTAVEAFAEKPSAKAFAGEACTPSPTNQSDDVVIEAVAASEYVQAAVRAEDGEEPANTLRAWILGFFFVTVSSGVNMLLSMRSPAITIPVVAILLLVYPIGCFWARVMPTRTFHTFGLAWSLNPGPFNIKEHTVVTLMASVTYGYAYSTDALLALQAKPGPWCWIPAPIHDQQPAHRYLSCWTWAPLPRLACCFDLAGQLFNHDAAVRTT